MVLEWNTKVYGSERTLSSTLYVGLIYSQFGKSSQNLCRGQEDQEITSSKPLDGQVITSKIVALKKVIFPQSFYKYFTWSTRHPRSFKLTGDFRL